MLYALGVGFGSNPMDENELPYVFENKSLKVVPTMASILTPGDLLAECGLDYSLVVLGEQKLDLFRPLPAKGRLLTDSRVVSVFDKGPDIGAVISVESEVRMAKDDTALFTVGSTVIARCDGGFGGPDGKGPTLVYYRPPAGYLEGDSIVTVLLARLKPGAHETECATVVRAE